MRSLAPGFRNGFRSAGARGGCACCEACASGEGACEGALLGPAEGCQTGACAVPGLRAVDVEVVEEVAGGDVWDQAQAAAQSARVAGGRVYRSARAAGEWMRAAGDGEDMQFGADEAARGLALSEAARRRNNRTPEQWAALPLANRDRLIVAEFARLPQAQRAAAWADMTEGQRAVALEQIGRTSGLSETEARAFAERERTADYALVTGLVGQGVTLIRQLIDTNNQQELEQIRQAARVQAARYTGSADGENAFLNALRLQQRLNGQQQLTTRSSGSGGALVVAAVAALALMGGRK